MKHLFNNIEKEERQRILEMHSNKKIVSEQGNFEPRMVEVNDMLYKIVEILQDIGYSNKEIKSYFKKFINYLL